MKTHLVQCLCPARHCIMSAAFEEPTVTVDKGTAALKKIIEETMERGRLNPYCGLCAAPPDQWSFEVKTIEDATLDQVKEQLYESERAQRAYAEAVDAQRKASNN